MKKYKLIMLTILLLSVFMFNKVLANDNIVLLGKVIYIDPGHGGVDPGAIYKDIKEEDLTLEISLKLKELLEKRGAIVYLTRDGDYDLSNKNATLRKRSDLSTRSNNINNSNADMYLSIHLNAESTGIWNGPQVFYDDINNKNEILASYIQASLKKELKTKREYKQINTGYLYKHVIVPGVLIEVGFLSNANERYLLQTDEYQYKICNAIIKGIEKYIYSN